MIFETLPARRGHFLLESGHHTDLWLTLDALFVDPRQIGPVVAQLANKLRPHAVSAVCGPLLGGAFLAQGVATVLGASFCYTEPDPRPPAPGLFKASYHLPPALAARVRGARVAVVDDVISAGSSVRATIAALRAAEASVVVVGALLILGEAAVTYFATQGVSVESIDRQAFNLWMPADCPLCRAGVSLEERRG